MVLDMTLKAEARALQQYEYDGDSPEYTARQWIDATMAEFLTVVHESGLPRNEWLEDTIAAHKWLRRRMARRCPTSLAVVYSDGGVWMDADTKTPHKEN